MNNNFDKYVESLCGDLNASLERNGLTLKIESNEFKINLNECYLNTTNGYVAAKKRLIILSEGLKIKFEPIKQQQWKSFLTYAGNTSWELNPAKLEINNNIYLPVIHIWEIDKSDEMIKLRLGRLLILLLDLAAKNFCCPITDIPLVIPNINANTIFDKFTEACGLKKKESAITSPILELDHCEPVLYEKIPGILMSRAANRIFGALPWSIKSQMIPTPLVRYDENCYCRNIREAILKWKSTTT